VQALATKGYCVVCCNASPVPHTLARQPARSSVGLLGGCAARKTLARHLQHPAKQANLIGLEPARQSLNHPTAATYGFRGLDIPAESY